MPARPLHRISELNVNILPWLHIIFKMGSLDVDDIDSNKFSINDVRNKRQNSSKKWNENLRAASRYNFTTLALNIVISYRP